MNHSDLAKQYTYRDNREWTLLINTAIKYSFISTMPYVKTRLLYNQIEEAEYS